MKKLCILFVLSLACAASAATTQNDDSCDIGVAPAATLLLPYFEVDLDDPHGEVTIFTITNVTNVDRIARVTLWTDYAVPMLTFNIELTGYAVQSINLYDLIGRGVLLPETSTARGRYSKANPASSCEGLRRTVPREELQHIQNAFLEGIYPEFGAPGCYNIGNEHENAVGYATVDLVSNCSTNDPFAEQYWTEDLAFDNALIGDFQQVHSANDFAQGSPMVHIRAIPEGGTAAERVAHPDEHRSKFPRTFYALFQPSYAPKLDSRQPLPTVFAARWVSQSGTPFNTFFKIWREGRTGRDVTCATHDDNVMRFAEVVLFDDAENAAAHGLSNPGLPIRTLTASSMISVRDADIIPQLSNGAVGGWVYLNLDNFRQDADASSNWVITSMRAEGRYSVDMDAAALGNGCSAPAPDSEVTRGSAVIGPRP